jgi:hypothetical protein
MPLQATFDYEHEHRFTEHEHCVVSLSTSKEREHGAAKPIQIDFSH